jgi:hypothetical protein
MSPEYARSTEIVPMSDQFEACALSVQQLSKAVTALDTRWGDARLAPLEGRDWYELLTRKLVPQLSDQSFLIAAVVGGTNIGKSVVFNHLAGFRASATSPLASGTKHPTCLVPKGFRKQHDLAQLFPGFVLREWAGADEPLKEEGQDWLFIRESEQTPANLLILDTPDVDSDARVNWDRADKVRRCADVLVAVLTQQKYNDAAVKEFFRKAAAEEKSILLVFNQCLLPEDEPYWPLWVGTFCDETKIQPQILYVAPNDRRAAEALQLPFYERAWPVKRGAVGNGQWAVGEPEGTSGHPPSAIGHQPSAVPQPSNLKPQLPRNLMTDLTSLRFGEIKLRSLSGSLKELIDPHHGVPAWLQEVRSQGDQYKRAAELLTANKLAVVGDWPTIPSSLLVSEVREWWGHQRKGWTARIHDSYNLLSRAVMVPVRMVRDRVQGEPVDPVVQYREREWAAVLETIEEVYEKLEWLAELGNDLLKPRLTRLLTGVSRADLIRTIRQSHDSTDIAAELRTLVQTEMASFSEQSPEFFKLFRRLDSLAAAARPAVSVILAVTGVGLVGDVVFTSAATSTIGHLTADVVGGTVAASVGESVISEGVSQGTSLLQLRLRMLHQRFASVRAAWLAKLLKDHLLGTLPEDLQAASRIALCPEFLDAANAIDRVRASAAQHLR